MPRGSDLEQAPPMAAQSNDTKESYSYRQDRKTCFSVSTAMQLSLLSRFASTKAEGIAAMFYLICWTCPEAIRDSFPRYDNPRLQRGRTIDQVTFFLLYMLIPTYHLTNMAFDRSPERDAGFLGTIGAVNLIRLGLFLEALCSRASVRATSSPTEVHALSQASEEVSVASYPEQTSSRRSSRAHRAGSRNRYHLHHNLESVDKNAGAVRKAIELQKIPTA